MDGKRSATCSVRGVQAFSVGARLIPRHCAKTLSRAVGFFGPSRGRKRGGKGSIAYLFKQAPLRVLPPYAHPKPGLHEAEDRSYRKYYCQSESRASACKT